MRQAATIASIVPMVTNLRALSKSLLDAGVTSVGLVWQPPPGSQDGFGEDYGVMENTGFVLTRPIFSRSSMVLVLSRPKFNRSPMVFVLLVLQNAYSNYHPCQPASLFGHGKLLTW
jgi:hypothetical protein